MCDPSLAAALLGMKAEALTADLPTMGSLFEALCERDLRIYAEALGAELFHYQDYKNREIDAVIALPTGEWTAIEIKLGANQIDAAAEGLLKLQKALAKEDPANAPSVLCVLCGMTNAAYRRPDGVVRRFRFCRLNRRRLSKVLNLLAHLLNQQFEVEARVRHLNGGGFAAQRIGFTVHFLHQEVQTLADGAARG